DLVKRSMRGDVRVRKLDSVSRGDSTSWVPCLAPLALSVRSWHSRQPARLLRVYRRRPLRSDAPTPRSLAPTATSTLRCPSCSAPAAFPWGLSPQAPPVRRAAPSIPRAYGDINFAVSQPIGAFNDFIGQG